MVVAFSVAGGNGVFAMIAVSIAMVVAHIAFASWLKAPTRAGRKLMDEIEGLRMYLSVAERDEIGAMPAPGTPEGREPQLDAGRYEALLPYAMALDVEAAWTKRFTRAVGVVEAQRSMPAWYHGSATSMGLASLGSSLGSALTTQISSSATPPGSSSGGGGGGFSGGGGGGGGGGGR